MTETSAKSWRWPGFRRPDASHRDPCGQNLPLRSHLDPRAMSGHLLRDLGLRPRGQSLSVFDFHED